MEAAICHDSRCIGLPVHRVNLIVLVDDPQIRKYATLVHVHKDKTHLILEQRIEEMEEYGLMQPAHETLLLISLPLFHCDVLPC